MGTVRLHSPLSASPVNTYARSLHSAVLSAVLLFTALLASACATMPNAERPGGFTSSAAADIATTPQSPTIAELPRDDAAAAARRLATRILAAVDIEDAQNAVSEIFAWAGIRTRSLTGEERAGLFPTMPFGLYDFQARSMAVDAQRRASGGWRLTLAELGTGPASRSATC
jgi:hypothetical protein